MYNLDENQTALKVLAADTYDDLIRTSSDDAIDHFKLIKGNMAPPHFCL